MGFCCSKDDAFEEGERIYFEEEKYTEEDIRELGQCGICGKNNILVSFHLNEGCLCCYCEAAMIGRRGMEDVYDIRKSFVKKFNAKKFNAKKFNSKKNIERKKGSNFYLL